ncbi:MAG TPA: response regulator transcription factor [Gaiellaceae bacterium]|nr:response regulator transcription factor [Gaiellaceae bacterium]
MQASAPAKSFASPTRRATGRVLVVDDDRSLRQAIVRALELEGYDVSAAEDGAAALSFFDDDVVMPDVVVLDVLMPNLDGFTTCRAIRTKSRVPILMLTARNTVDDRVEGLDAGADDYLSKPFAVVELLARLRALLRRTSGSNEVLRYRDLELDPAERRVLRAGRQIELTRIEFSLLELLLSHPHKVISRAAIFAQVWGYDIELASNSLEVYVGYLRRKTEEDGGSRLIQTVRGIGYVLRESGR